MAKKRRGRNEGALFEDKDRKRWTVRVTVAGKRYEGNAQTKALAQEKLLNLQSKAKQGLLGVDKVSRRSVKTVEQVVRDYVEHGVAHKKIRESTAQRYEGIIQGKIATAFPVLSVRDLTRAQLDAFIAREHDHNSAASVLKTYNLIRASLGRAVEEGLVSENVCSKRLRPKVKKEEVVPFTQEEMNALLNCARLTKHRDENLLLVAFRTGLRSGELLGLHWENVDFKAQKLKVSHTLVNYGRKPTRGDTKNGKTRTIDLSTDVIAALRNQQEKLLSEGHPRPWVFPNTQGKPGNRNHLLCRFKVLCKEAEVSVLNFHATRHTFASLALRAGVDYKTIQKILGHYSVALTIDTYAHLAEDAQRSAVAKMDRLFAVGAT